MAEKNGDIKNLNYLSMNGVHEVWIHSQMQYRKVKLMRRRGSWKMGILGRKRHSPRLHFMENTGYKLGVPK